MSQVHVPTSGMAKPVSRSNRRATIRYRCAPATIGKVFAASGHEFQRAWILDLSLQGIGMHLPRPIDSGTLVLVVIKSNDGAKSFELSAKVMHCHALPQGEYFVGCELTKLLTPDDLEQLL